MLDFKKLKSVNTLEKLQKAVEEEAKSKSYGDDPNEYWSPKRGKDGNGTAKIRLLPSPPQDDEDGLPWAKWFEHNFSGPGGYYIHKSLTTFKDKNDPCQDYNNKLWASKIDANTAQAKKQKRKQRICSNVLILEDKLQPEFEGKVRKYKYGAKIWGKIDGVMTGDEDNPGFDPFSFFEGADFRIKIKTIKMKIDGRDVEQPNYDDSSFLARAPLSKDDAYLEEIWKQEFSLKALIAENQFKSYDELLKDLIRVIGFDPRSLNIPVAAVTEKKDAVTPKVVDASDDTPPWNVSDEDASTMLAKFRDLANDD